MERNTCDLASFPWPPLPVLPLLVSLGEEGGRGHENKIVCSHKLLTFLSSDCSPSPSSDVPISIAQQGTQRDDTTYAITRQAPVSMKLTQEVIV